MARSDDRFLVRAPQDASLEGDIWGIELKDEHGSPHRYGIAGADGKAEQTRKSNETARVSAEADRKSSETARAAAERERAAQQAKNNADQKANNAAAQGLQVVKLSGGQYDPSTLKPTVSGDVGKLYFVPDPKGGSDSLYAEWMHIDGKWEKVGMSTAQIAGLTTGQIDSVASGGSVTSESVLTGTGLTYLWTKLKAAFSPKSHRHAIADVSGLSDALSQGGGMKFLDDVTDMNSVKETCLFMCRSKPANGPLWSSSGRLWGICIVSGGYGTQLVWPDSSSQPPAHRPMFSGNWSTWS